ncbi:unnamed protein product [Durusdinium trenchii]|uniref:Uncharacterized protein n=1 Tax=Durusdinium trenchii TaxID=1381693 RepID=A0ABP0Q349_9DINO
MTSVCGAWPKQLGWSRLKGFGAACSGSWQLAEAASGLAWPKQPKYSANPTWEGRAAGWSPDNTGQRVILRQPVGPPCLLIALFGALASSATAAFAALAAQSSLFGAGAGAVTACFVAGLSTADMLKRRNLLATEPASRHRRTK